MNSRKTGLVGHVENILVYIYIQGDRLRENGVRL